MTFQLAQNESEKYKDLTKRIQNNEFPLLTLSMLATELDHLVDYLEENQVSFVSIGRTPKRPHGVCLWLEKFHGIYYPTDTFIPTRILTQLVRKRFFDTKIKILRQLSNAAKTKTHISLWEDFRREFSLRLTNEEIQLYYRLDCFLFAQELAKGTVPYTGGLVDLCELVWFVYREILKGTSEKLQPHLVANNISVAIKFVEESASLYVGSKGYNLGHDQEAIRTEVTKLIVNWKYSEPSFNEVTITYGPRLEFQYWVKALSFTPSPQFRTVIFNGSQLALTELEGLVVRVLYESFLNTGNKELTEKEIQYTAKEIQKKEQGVAKFSNLRDVLKYRKGKERIPRQAIESGLLIEVERKREKVYRLSETITQHKPSIP